MEDEDASKSSATQQSRALTSPEASLALSTQYRTTVRSCLTCHHRKIRCDKRSPCSNCARNNVLCCYPGIEQVRHRPQRTTIGEISARLARLERTICAITENGPTTPDLDRKPAAEITAPHSDGATGEGPRAESSPEELLVQDGDTSRYINEVILSRILDKVRATLLYMDMESRG